MDCVTFLREQALGIRKEGKGRLLVVGGGNAAIDSARVGWRMGFEEVYILYRRTKKEMPANPWEVDAAEHEGVKLQYLVAPLEILGANGRVTGMKCMQAWNLGNRMRRAAGALCRWRAPSLSWRPRPSCRPSARART